MSIEHAPRVAALAAALAGLTLMNGCGPDGPPTAPVTGTVTLDGEPLPEVTVTFMPDPNAGTLAAASRAVTDDRGVYVLTYQGPDRGPGAAVGQHVVTVSDRRAEESRGEEPYRIPLGYGESARTPLRAAVAPADGDAPQTIDLELTGRP